MAANTERQPPLPLPPPRSETGVAGWMLANLFNSWYSGVLTILSAVVIGLVLWFGLKWIIVDADWRVISTLGGRMIIGQYNTEAACPGQNCFWRPQVALLLVTALLGMGWGVQRGPVHHAHQRGSGRGAGAAGLPALRY